MTTPKPLLRALEARDGHVSAWTGEDVPELVPQHRQGGMGGISKFADPRMVPVEHAVHGLVFLSDDGRAVDTGPEPSF